MSCFYTKLDDEALLHITGPDALTFLQGQVTCDTRKLSPEHSLPGLHCTVQGRVVCDFLLAQLAPAHVALRMRRDIVTASAALLAKYAIFSKAKLDAQRDDWQVLACWGSASSQVLLELFGAVPGEKYGACAGEGFTLVQVDTDGQQFECYLNSTLAADLLAQLQARMTAGTPTTWQTLQIASGIARIESGTADEYLPQPLNYDITGHISFTKGCYTGQEIVARMHYRGKPKRRLYLATVATDSLGNDAIVTAGTVLYDRATQRSAGNVINCVISTPGQATMLMTATADGVAAGLQVGRPGGPIVTPGTLPYQIAPG